MREGVHAGEVVPGSVVHEAVFGAAWDATARTVFQRLDAELEALGLRSRGILAMLAEKGCPKSILRIHCPHTRRAVVADYLQHDLRSAIAHAVELERSAITRFLDRCLQTDTIFCRLHASLKPITSAGSYNPPLSVVRT